MSNEHQDSTEREHHVDEIIAAYLEAERNGRAPGVEQWLEQNADVADELRSFLADRAHLQKVADGDEVCRTPIHQSDDTATIPPGSSNIAQDAPSLAPTDNPPAPGTSVRYFGDYELIEEIARGGMGVVYKARQVSLDRIVALKMILTGQLASASDVERFQREAQSAANLDHPNIVPIYEVGDHDGQQYFSMKLVEGGSLAEILSRRGTESAEDEKETLRSPRHCVKLLADVARGVHHAHQRGILHRDLKPGNILLGSRGEGVGSREEKPSGTMSKASAQLSDKSNSRQSLLPTPSSLFPMITDFGLAKKTQGDTALTQSGAIVGTPAYMAPEQARAEKDLSVAVDVYSLGAILYELLAGRPPFQAETPLDVILQVLEREPESPRRFNAKVDRDLETICLKCLHKDPAQRYASAAALADDLERWLQDEPIHARPISPAERFRRRAGKRWRQISWPMKVAPVLLLIAAAALYGWYVYSQSQRGELLLISDDTNLTAELLAADTNQAVAAKFTVPNPEPIKLAPGPYRVRLTKPKHLSEIVDIQLEPQQKFPLKVQLTNHYLRPPLVVPKNYRLTFLTKQPSYIEMHADGLLLRDFMTGDEIWTNNLDPKNQPRLAAEKLQRWHDLFSRTSSSDLPIRFVDPTPDLNGDGVGDLVFYNGEHRIDQNFLVRVRHPGGEDKQKSRSVTAKTILAVSGKTGDVLWLRLVEPQPLEFAQPQPEFSITAQTSIAGDFSVLDVDGDRTTDLISGFSMQANSLDGRRAAHWLEAVSGKDGKTIWRTFTDPNWIQHLKPEVRQNFNQPANRNNVYIAGAPKLLTIKGVKTLVLLEGRSFLGFDPKSGKPAWQPVELEQLPDTAGRMKWQRFVDLDGDGNDDLLFLSDLDKVGQELAAVSLTSRKLLWREKVRMDFDRHNYDQRAWPLLQDVNADGKPDILIQDYSGIALLNGETGKQMWQSDPGPMGSSARTQQYIFGQDLNNDGHRELFVATHGRYHNYNGKWFHWLIVRALSGKDGSELWAWRNRLPRDASDYSFEALEWWHTGPDGRPILVVPYVYRPTSTSDRQSTVYFLAAGCGRKLHELSGIDNLKRLDLNADGVPDLLGTHPPQHDLSRNRHKIVLCAFGGCQPEAWRRHGAWKPAQDFNGDGIVDLLPMSVDELQRYIGERPPIRAVSGVDAKILWESSTQLSGICYSLSLPDGDLNGDGTPDVISTMQRGNSHEPFITVISGTTGEQLWQVPKLSLEKGINIEAVHAVAVSRKPSTVVVIYQLTASSQPYWRQLRIAAFTSETGQFVWDKKLSEKIDDNRTMNFFRLPMALADLNNDGELDVVAWTLTHRLVQRQRLEENQFVFHLRAVNGKDGATLWTVPVVNASGHSSSFHNLSAPQVGDLDDDGKTELVYLEKLDAKQINVVAIDGATGEKKWTWKAAPFSDAWVQDRKTYSWNSDSGLRHYGTRWQMPRLVDFNGDGKMSICFTVFESIEGKQRFGTKKTQLYVLNHDGKQQWRKEIPGAWARPLWKIALGNDGKQAIAFVDEPKSAAKEFRHKLFVFGGDGEPLWHWQLPAGWGQILQVDENAKKPATVVTQSGNDVFGLAADTGTILWRWNAAENEAIGGAHIRVLNQNASHRSWGQTANVATFAAAARPDLPDRLFLRLGYRERVGSFPSQNLQTTTCRLIVALGAGDTVPWARPTQATEPPAKSTLPRITGLIGLSLFALLVLWLIWQREWSALGPMLIIGVMLAGALHVFLHWMHGAGPDSNSWYEIIGYYGHQFPRNTLILESCWFVSLILVWHFRLRWIAVGVGTVAWLLFAVVLTYALIPDLESRTGGHFEFGFHSLSLAFAILVCFTLVISASIRAVLVSGRWLFTPRRVE